MGRGVGVAHMACADDGARTAAAPRHLKWPPNPRAVILRRNILGSDEESRVSLEVDWL